MSVMYFLKYPDGKWVRRDDSTGLMSTGGEPEPVSSITKATIWWDKDEALRYAHICRSDNFVLYQVEVKPLEAYVSPGEKAKAAEDKEYLLYLKLAQRFGDNAPTECKFNIAWAGQCKQDTEIGEEFCEKHLGEKCYECMRQATRDCGHAGQFVCGMPMCDEHKHHGGY